MTGSKPPESPDRVTPDADDLTKTRYGDPYSPPSAAGSPPSSPAPGVSASSNIAVQPVRAVGTPRGDDAAARPARALDSEPPPDPAPRTTPQPERAKPPVLPSKRRGESSPPSAAGDVEPRASLEQTLIHHGDQTRAAGSPETEAVDISANRPTPEPERVRGGAESEAAHSRWRSTPSPRLRMSRTDVLAATPALGRRVYPRDTVITPPRRWSRWPLLSMLALGLSVVALGVAITTLVPHWSMRRSNAAKSRAADVPTISDRSAATSPQSAGQLAQTAALPQDAVIPPLTAAEPAAPRAARRESPPRKVRVDPLPPPVPAAPSKRNRGSAVDGGVIAELEREARDRLAEPDYAAAKRVYERLHAMVPGRREYTAMLDLLTTRLASCGQPGAGPCSTP